MIVFKIYTIVTILLVTFLWGIPSVISAFYGAPWLATTKSSAKKMLKLAKIKKGDVVYDLGSGYSRILILAARRYGARCVGIEIDPIKCFVSQVTIFLLGLRKKITIINGDLFKKDLSSANVIFCFLLQKTNEKLMKKLERELRPGTRIVSNSFTFPEWKIIKKDKERSLYLYISGKSYIR